MVLRGLRITRRVVYFMGKGLSADFYKVLDDNELMKHYVLIRYEPSSLDNAAHNLEVEVA